MTSDASSLIRTVDEMLLDAGAPDAAGLRAALLELGTLACLPVPVPGPELAALLSGQSNQLARHRLLREHRAAVVGLTVIAGMGLGVTGVAATGTAPDAQASSSIQHLLQDWAPDWTIIGTPPSTGSAVGLRDAQPPAEPASQNDQAPARPETTEPEGALPGNGAENAGQNRSTEPAGRGNATSPGNPKADDAGVSGNAGIAPGGAASQDAATGESHDPAKGATDAAAEPDKAGRPVTEETGTGNAGPGSTWLNKFNR